MYQPDYLITVTPIKHRHEINHKTSPGIELLLQLHFPIKKMIFEFSDSQSSVRLVCFLQFFIPQICYYNNYKHTEVY